MFLPLFILPSEIVEVGQMSSPGVAALHFELKRINEQT